MPSRPENLSKLPFLGQKQQLAGWCLHISPSGPPLIGHPSTYISVGQPIRRTVPYLTYITYISPICKRYLAQKCCFPVGSAPNRLVNQPWLDCALAQLFVSMLVVLWPSWQQICALDILYHAWTSVYGPKPFSFFQTTELAILGQNEQLTGCCLSIRTRMRAPVG